MNNHGVSKGQFAETDAKYFESGALRTITNITS